MVESASTGEEVMRPNPSESDLEQYLENLSRRSKGMQEKVSGSTEGRASNRDRSPGRTPVLAIEERLRKPVSSPARSPIYRSKWEAAYAAKLELEKRVGIIKAYWYEPFSLWMPGKVRFKPDFMIHIETQVGQPSQQIWTDELHIIEVKGWSRNRRDGITRLKIAAALFPCFVWRMVWMKKGGGFDGEYV